MNIVSAKFSNPDNSAVLLNTVEAGAVIVFLDGDDVSGGWRPVYLAWAETHETEPFTPDA